MFGCTFILCLKANVFNRKLGTVENLSSDNVSEVLSNIGAGFANSDEEAEAARLNRWANMESDDDDFFVLDGSNFNGKISCCSLSYSILNISRLLFCLISLNFIFL